jgi:hypothetical protein
VIAFTLRRGEYDLSVMPSLDFFTPVELSRIDFSHGTVKNHVFSIFRKLGVQSRFELTKFVSGRR